MRGVLIALMLLLLPGCAIVAPASSCQQERAALRTVDASIADAQQRHKRVFAAQLASRGQASYLCRATDSGQVHCRKGDAAAVPDTEQLHRARGAIVARIAQVCR
jgi:hypothetical protein